MFEIAAILLLGLLLWMVSIVLEKLDALLASRCTDPRSVHALRARCRQAEQHRLVYAGLWREQTRKLRRLQKP